MHSTVLLFCFICFLKTKKASIGSKCTWKFNINYRNGVVVANYGDKSVYFDLEDLGNTIGLWDLYVFDAPSPYNPLRVRFSSVNLFIVYSFN